MEEEEEYEQLQPNIEKCIAFLYEIKKPIRINISIVIETNTFQIATDEEGNEIIEGRI